MPGDADDSLIDTIGLAERGGIRNDFARMMLENLKTSGPGRQRRQRHQDRFGIAAGLEAELGAAVV